MQLRSLTPSSLATKCSPQEDTFDSDQHSWHDFIVYWLVVNLVMVFFMGKDFESIVNNPICQPMATVSAHLILAAD